MVDLEERLRAEVTRRSWEYEPSAQLPERIQARVQQRRRARQLTAGTLVVGAAAALVLLVLVLRPDGGDEDSVVADDGHRPTVTTTTTEATSTTSTTTTTTGEATSTTGEATTAPSTTTSPDTPAPVAIGDLTKLAYPFADGVAALPPPCRSYWESLAPETPTDFFPPTTNGIELVGGATAVGDVDGDGIADGVAAFHCTYPGSPPSPGGLLVVRARDRAVVFSDADELSQANVALTGDPRTVMRAPVTVAPSGSGEAAQIVARVGSYLPEDPNAGPSREADARFVLDGDGLRLVGLDPSP